MYSATSFKIALHRVCFRESKKFWLLLIFPQESLWWEVVRNLRIYRCAFSIRFRFGHFYIADQWKFCIEFISNRKYWELLSTATLWSYQTFNCEMQLGVKAMRLTNHFAIALFMVLESFLTKTSTQLQIIYLLLKLTAYSIVIDFKEQYMLLAYCSPQNLSPKR